MEKRLFDSELKVMETLWENGELSAKQIAELLRQQIGWSKTTTYTVLKKCIDKEIIKRSDPNYIFSACISKEDVRQYETHELINKMYDGAPDKLVASIIGNEKMDKDMIRHLKELIQNL